jgi:hypothetical protein
MNYFQKITTVLSLIGSAIFIGLSFNIDESLIRFLIVGEVPGSSTSLSPDTMLLVLSFCFAVLLLVTIRPIAFLRYFNTFGAAKHYLPKRRYSSIQ